MKTCISKKEVRGNAMLIVGAFSEIIIDSVDFSNHSDEEEKMLISAIEDVCQSLIQRGRKMGRIEKIPQYASVSRFF